jgi:predicted membrane GTPase involved in stress response
VTPRLLQRAHPRAGFRRGTTLMHPECPIEQALRSDDPLVQAELAREIWRRHSFVDDGALLVAEAKRLRVLARTEGALRAPVEALRERYGGALVVEPPSVRYAHGALVLEPHMTVLLCGPERYLPLVQKDLARRRGHCRRIDDHANRFVLEAEAPLAGLLGYGDWLDELTEADAELSMWLARYVPIDDGGPRAA